MHVCVWVLFVLLTVLAVSHADPDDDLVGFDDDLLGNSTNSTDTDSPLTDAPDTEFPLTQLPPTELPLTGTPEPTTGAPTMAPATLSPEICVDLPNDSGGIWMIGADTCSRLSSDIVFCSTAATGVDSTLTVKEACCFCGGGFSTRPPETLSPPTPAPETSAPPTPSPPTVAPDTRAPLTLAPLTPAPPTAAPSTDAPLTSVPIPPTPAPATLTPEICRDHTLLDGSKWALDDGTTCEVADVNIRACISSKNDTDNRFAAAEACCTCGGGAFSSRAPATPLPPTLPPLTASPPTPSPPTLSPPTVAPPSPSPPTVAPTESPPIVAPLTASPFTPLPTVTTDVPVTLIPGAVCNDHVLLDGTEWTTSEGAVCTPEFNDQLCSDPTNDTDSRYAAADACCGCGGGYFDTTIPDTEVPTSAPNTSVPAAVPVCDEQWSTTYTARIPDNNITVEGNATIFGCQRLDSAFEKIDSQQQCVIDGTPTSCRASNADCACKSEWSADGVTSFTGCAVPFEHLMPLPTQAQGRFIVLAVCQVESPELCQESDSSIKICGSITITNVNNLPASSDAPTPGTGTPLAKDASNDDDSGSLLWIVLIAGGGVCVVAVGIILCLVCRDSPSHSIPLAFIPDESGCDLHDFMDADECLSVESEMKSVNWEGPRGYNAEVTEPTKGEWMVAFGKSLKRTLL